MDIKISTLKSFIEESNNIVFFGGAGVSTESGIPDFRSQNGLYNQTYKYSPERILSHEFFINNTEEFYRFYKDKMINENVEPNTAHKMLTELEKRGKLKAIITQNIDGLHQLCGSKKVLELHGTIHKNKCMKCNKSYDLKFVKGATGIPKCECGGIVKPEVVLYDENLDNQILEMSIDYILKADMLIVGGTSLNVYPAAGLINYYRGDKLVLINKTKTPKDHMANLVINSSLGDVLKEAGKQ